MKEFAARAHVSVVYQYLFVRPEDVDPATDQVLPDSDTLRYTFEAELENPRTQASRKEKLREIQWTEERTTLVKRRIR